MWIALFVITMHGLGLLSAFKAMMESRTAQGAIAWVIFLLAMPYVAVPAYWIFGRSRFKGYVKARDYVLKEGSDILDRLRKAMGRYRPPFDKRHAVSAAEAMADTPFTRTNEVELLIDGDATFSSILKGIDRAQKYVLFQFYIVHDDGLGRQVQRRLIDKARAGVPVYFLYDEIGSHSLDTSYLHTLREAGVRISSFGSRQGWSNKFQLNFRNHRKVVVVDGREAWIGGHNVGDEYLGKDPRIGHWRDTHLRFAGPAVMGAQLSFAEDWYWATGTTISELDWTPQPSKEGDASVLVIPTGPADPMETAELMFLHSINSAREQLWIASPYFVPDDAVVFALQLAGLRGVDVRILIPDKADHLIVWLSSFSYFAEAGMTGVRFYRYTEGFLHEKVMLIDRKVATVGTANFDNRSFRLNFEITAVVEDAAFVEKVEAMFLDDFAHSELQPVDIMRHKPFWFKTVVRLARLAAPVQ